ncbi:MAG: methylated-DNA--[protein]-cysteine S-methyltransferase [Actinobacteria bacterium]|nr:methylated-DNA--[protein]-cysteine S-methyltransferase [Actinomycetota bacterium]
MRVTRHPYQVEGWGVGELWLGDGRVVLAHDAPAPTPLRTPRGTPGAPTDTLAPELSRERDGFFEDLVQRLHRYFAGVPVSFAEVELDNAGTTPFQHAVADVLRHVPWGEVVTYGELAELAGYPRAARAAGTFCARNRFSLFLPCHRVVGAVGIGGYGSLGVAYKRRLLDLERHAAR